jgi:hypothetical protein
MDAHTHYLQPFPAMPVLVSGTFSRAAQGVNQGDVLDESNLTAATIEYADRKLLQKNDLATVQEVRDAKRRKQNLEVAHNFAGVAPIWAQGLGQQQTQLGQQLTQLGQQMQQMLQMQTQLGQRMQQQQGQMTELINNNTYTQSCNKNNQCVRFQTRDLARIPHMTTGEFPPAGEDDWYPRNFNEVESANNAQVDQLLQFYGVTIEGVSLSRKRTKVMQYLGIYEAP